MSFVVPASWAGWAVPANLVDPVDHDLPVFPAVDSETETEAEADIFSSSSELRNRIHRENDFRTEKKKMKAEVEINFLESLFLLSSCQIIF